jgi:hypothetical protein
MDYEIKGSYGFSPANQLGNKTFLWIFREYGLSGVWFKREFTVVYSHGC